MIEVPTTEAMRHIAATLARQACAATLRGQPSYTGLDGTPQRYLVGYLGEMAFGAWLRDGGKRFRYRAGTSVSQGPEFTVWIEDEAYTLDVKTRDGAERDLFMMPWAQALREDGADIFVGARAAGAYVQLMGWIRRQDLAGLEPVQVLIPTVAMEFEDMRSMAELAATLDVGERTVLTEAA